MRIQPPKSQEGKELWVGSPTPSIDSGSGRMFNQLCLLLSRLQCIGNIAAGGGVCHGFFGWLLIIFSTLSNSHRMVCVRIVPALTLRAPPT
jgi:hypothetical protein